MFDVLMIDSFCEWDTVFYEFFNLSIIRRQDNNSSFE